MGKFKKSSDKSGKLANNSLKSNQGQRSSVASSAVNKTFIFDNTMASWEGIEHNIEAYFIEHGVSLHLLKTFILCVDELVSNIIFYAFFGEDSASVHKIEMTVNITCGKIWLVLVDDGSPFDLTQAPKAELKTVLEDIKLGGLGIHLVMSLMDEVSYTRVDNHNVVTISKNREVSNAT